MAYWLGVLICVLIYVCILTVLLRIKHIKGEINNKTKNIVNIVLISIIMLSYLTTLLIYFYGADDLYNFNHGLPFANISPFLFTFCFSIFILRDSLAKALKSIYAFLSIGMVIAMIVLPLVGNSINGVEHFMTESIFDCISHGCSSLLGIWFIVSNQVELKKKNLFIGLLSIFIIIFILIILNTCFNQNFFGMSPLANWNIYSFLSFDSYILTLLTYLSCIGVLMIITYATYKGIIKLITAIKHKNI